MKKKVLRELREMRDDMPLNLVVNHRGVPQANCRYRKMKKIYSRGGMQAVKSYYDQVMFDYDEIEAKNDKIKKKLSDKINGNQKEAVEATIVAHKTKEVREETTVEPIKKKSIWSWILKMVYRLTWGRYGSLGTS